MGSQFSQQPEWTEIQGKVLQSEPNLIVSGCAGSGKTLLACHIAMRHSKNGKVAILVFTKALRTFISDYIYSFGCNNITVLYDYEWRVRDSSIYDIIVVDEYQDFSSRDISTIISCARQGVYLFGDSEQKIYSKNFQKEITLNFDELCVQTSFEHIRLTDNFRISEENKNFIVSLYPNNSLKTANFSTGFKPNIKRFENEKDELKWLKEFMLSNKEYKNIGILTKRNDSFNNSYFLPKDTIYGIMELHEFFTSNGINCGYKYKNYDNLNFSNECSINIMTYHSSKGLQFDCVILPFLNYENTNSGAENLPYVGLTRSSKQIIITYSGFVAEEYSVPVLSTTFEGEIVSRIGDDELSIWDTPFKTPKSKKSTG